VTVQIGERTILCVAAGLFLIRAGDDAFVAVVRGGESHGPPTPNLVPQAMAVSRETAEPN
jgi:hypothetical protein